MLPEAAHGKPLEVWFRDEARVGQQGTLTRVRARRGSRPRAVRDTRYQWTYPGLFIRVPDLVGGDGLNCGCGA